ncbi:Beta-barrel assembly-enhancing protease [Enhygromyxa salina]|uniref:Beta-barrel assembly-enhancing protease n=1 Tax=Enhygromyxa salina TaxID=215803 RepID=A0A2S9XSM4_9BACT|nr:helix-turn-helix domain-containing protein [Enhygromyxa salina]PRP95867.1 Beta-barrel assembly-enhancing protease [Enhygromyxa salina]
MSEARKRVEVEASNDNAEHLYTVAEVARLFELPESRVRYWSQTGFISPSIRRGARRFYTFKDLISIKVAKELLDAGLPLQRVRRSLDALRYHLPRVDSPLARLRIRSDSDRILVEDGDTTFEATTGQLLLDFDVDKLRDRVAEVLTLPWVGADQVEPSLGPASAYVAFQRGLEQEEQWDGVTLGSPRFVAAVAAYEQAVELDPSFAAAWTNLGSLLAFTADLDRARDCFDQALQNDPDQPEAQCNLAELALRSGEVELAISGFRQVLRSEPDQLEAHYGLARALLEVGGKGQALAHLERFSVGVQRLPPTERNRELEQRQRQVQRVIVLLRQELG